MKKILVPTDFSEPARLATDVAIEIAKKTGAAIMLLHVIEAPSSESYNVEGQVSRTDDWEDQLFTLKLIEVSKRKLKALSEQLLQRDLAVSYRLKMGNPFHGIGSTITDEKADLVVMGTSGMTKLEEMIIGSNTEKVVRHAKCPVLTVHGKCLPVNFKNIVYATSLTENEQGFSKVITDAQDMFGATVHLVRVNTPGNFMSDLVVKKQMKDFAKNLQLKNYTLNVFNDFTEEKGILHFADTIKADLIALGTHGRTGIAHIIAGSIAEDIANHASKPVLTYVNGSKN